MRVLIVFNHPYEGSYCSAILDTVKFSLLKYGHEYDLIHLDNDEFDPVMRAKDLQAFVRARTEPEASTKLLDTQVLEYKEKLLVADHIIFIFPIWWELMPALMKGFIDKVIFPGIVYDYASDKGIGMNNRLTNITGITMITTMNTPSILYRFVFGNPIKKAVFTGTFMKIGIKNRKWINLSYVKFCSLKKRQKWLLNIESYIGKLK